MIQESVMEISSDFVGTPLKPYHSTVKWRDTMNYAAAIDVINQQGDKAISHGYALLVENDDLT